MELSPRLIDVVVPRDPAGVVLVLHGGASRRRSVAVSPAQLSVLRMLPIARAAARAGDGRLAVFRLLNAQRGWDASHTPVDDASWALGEVERRLGARLPTALIGHSLGGRAALLSAAAPGVRAVAALAPWVYPDDVAPGLDGQAILIVHGTRDRIASPQRSRALADNLVARTPTTYVPVEGGKHAMLSHHREFTAPATDLARGALLGEARSDVVRQLLARAGFGGRRPGDPAEVQRLEVRAAQHVSANPGSRGGHYGGRHGHRHALGLPRRRAARRARRPAALHRAARRPRRRLEGHGLQGRAR